MKRRSLKAFTLIEVLVAVSIFSLSIVGLLSVIAVSQRNFVEAGLRSKGMFLAEQKMNQMFRVGYQPISEDDEGYVLDESDEENPVELVVIEGEFFDDKNPEFDRSEAWLADWYWQVIYRESEQMLGMQTITVRVFNKRFNEVHEYMNREYGLIAELVCYVSATRRSQIRTEEQQ